MLEADITLPDNLVFISLSFPYLHNLQPQQSNSAISGWLFGQRHWLALGMKQEKAKSRGIVVRVTT